MTIRDRRVKGGAAEHPGWYRNQAGSTASEGRGLPGARAYRDRRRRERLWKLAAQQWPAYDEYQTRTDREIPVVVLSGAERQPVLRSAAAIPAIERSSGRRRRLVAGAVAAQQLDLDRVHRVDVRVPQLDRALDARLAVEQPSSPRRSRARASTVRSCSAASSAQIRSRLGSGGRASRYDARDLDARLRERHLEVLDERAEERPARGRAGAASRAARPRAAAANAAPAAVPRRQQAAVLRPGEHPRDRAQRRSSPVAAASGRDGRARADLEQRELVDRRERAEEARERRRPPRRGAVRALGACGRDRSIVSRAPSFGGSSATALRERGQQRRGERGLEVPLARAPAGRT